MHNQSSLRKLPAAARKRVKVRWIGEKKAPNARRWWMREASPSGPSSPRPTVTTRRSWMRPSRPWSRSGSCRIERACISTAGLRFEGYPREARGPRSERRDRPERQARPTAGCETLGRGTHELVAQRAHTKKLAWCTERCGRVIDFWVAFSDVVIIVRRLVRKAGSATAGKPDLPVGHDLLTEALSTVRNVDTLRRRVQSW